MTETHMRQHKTHMRQRRNPAGAGTDVRRCSDALGPRKNLHRRAPHGRVPHLRVFLARRTRVARILISTPRMVEKLLIVGDSAVRLLVTLGARSAW